MFIKLTPLDYKIPSPFVPLPFSKGKGELLKRGANAPLKHPDFSDGAMHAGEEQKWRKIG
jgi:hypothetical protein